MTQFLSPTISTTLYLCPPGYKWQPNQQPQLSPLPITTISIPHLLREPPNTITSLTTTNPSKKNNTIFLIQNLDLLQDFLPSIPENCLKLRQQILNLISSINNNNNHSNHTLIALWTIKSPSDNDTSSNSLLQDLKSHFQHVEIIPFPSQSIRHQQLTELLVPKTNNIDPLTITKLSERTAGLSTKDIQYIFSRVLVLQQQQPPQNIITFEPSLSSSTSQKKMLYQFNLSPTITTEQPSTTSNNNNNPWLSTIIGYTSVKHQLTKLITWQFHPTRSLTLKKLGIKPSGILLHGPSGCGKTTLITSLSAITLLITVRPADIFSKWFGESEEFLRNIFKRARAQAPCILFIDDVDIFAPKRSSVAADGTGGNSSSVSYRILSTLLNELDGIEESHQQFLVVGATNKLQFIDEAAIRPGRLGTLIEIPLPSLADRLLMLQTFTNKMNIDSSAHQILESFVQFMEGWSGAQIKAYCVKAALLAIRMNSEIVTEDMLRDALFNIMSTR
jgi:AAA+ superfamily predicted ATPase